MSETRASILLVDSREDSPLAGWIEHAVGWGELTRVPDVQAALTVLHAGGADLVLANAMGVGELLAFVGQVTADVPLVVVVPRESAGLAQSALEAGAYDVLIEDEITPPLLGHVLRGALKQGRTQTKLQTLTRMLRVSEANFHNIIEKNADTILVVDRSGRIRLANRAAERLFGRPTRDLVGTVFGSPLVVGEITELDIRRPDGDLVISEMRVVDAEWEGEPVWLATLRDMTERKIAEQALRDERDFIDTVLDTEATLVIVLDTQGRIVRFNRACERLTQYAFDEVRGRHFWDFLLLPSEVDQVRAVFANLVEQNIPNQFENYWVARDGTQHLLAWSNTILRDSSGALEHVIGTGIDITQRKRAEDAEREQRALTEALRDTVSALLESTLHLEDVLDRLLHDVGRVVPHDAASIMFVDSGVARVVRSKGFDRYDLEGPLMDLRLRVDDAPNLNIPVQSGKPLVIPVTDQNPDWLQIPEFGWIRSHVKATIRREGHVIGFLNLESATPDHFTQQMAERLQTFADYAAIAIWNAQLYDMLRRHALELERRVNQRTAELERERAQLQAVLDSMGEGVIYVDEHGKVRYANRAYCRLTGYSYEEIVDNSDAVFDALLAPVGGRQVWSKKIAGEMDQGHLWRGELCLQRRDGSQFDAAATITSVTRPNKQLIGRVNLLRDISDEKALQAQKDRFIANASHELRTPLTNIRMRLHLISQQPEEFEAHWRVVNQVIARMEYLVDDLLDLSRFERGVIVLDLGGVLLQDLVSQVIAVQLPHAAAKQIDLAAELPDEPVIVFADEQRLVQVLTNLVTNAINYTPAGGDVLVRLSLEDAKDGRWAVLQVCDNGVGMTSETIAHIFEPFFRVFDSEAGGAGLGLTIAREIIESHGGELAVESEPGRGSTFSVRLALRQPADAFSV